MDYALLAATALGAIGLYLMLPSKRPPVARVGLILGAMALAGLLLYLLRIAAAGIPGVTPASAPPAVFYAFALIMIGSAAGVVCQPRPVYAALYFVLLTLAGAGIFVLLLAEFMAIVLIIIYAGAILVTYVFVIMLASQGSTGAVGETSAPEYDQKASEPFAAVFVAFLLIGTVLQVLVPSQSHPVLATPSSTPDPVMTASLADVQPMANFGVTTNPAEAPAPTSQPTNVQLLGYSLYSQYPLTLELAGILLTIALVGAVVIARKNVDSPQALGTGSIPGE